MLSEKPLTCFVCCNGELVTGSTFSNLVLSKHADVIRGGRVQLDDGSLVQLGWDIFGGLGQCPGCCSEKNAQLYHKVFPQQSGHDLSCSQSQPWYNYDYYLKISRCLDFHGYLIDKQYSFIFFTWFVFVVNVISCDWTVAIKSHCPAKRNGSIFHFSDFYFGRVWAIYWYKKRKKPLAS